MFRYYNASIPAGSEDATTENSTSMIVCNFTVVCPSSDLSPIKIGWHDCSHILGWKENIHPTRGVRTQHKIRWMGNYQRTWFITDFQSSHARFWHAEHLVKGLQCHFLDRIPPRRWKRTFRKTWNGCHSRVHQRWTFPQSNRHFGFIAYWACHREEALYWALTQNSPRISLNPSAVLHEVM